MAQHYDTRYARKAVDYVLDHALSIPYGNQRFGIRIPFGHKAFAQTVHRNHELYHFREHTRKMKMKVTPRTSVGREQPMLTVYTNVQLVGNTYPSTYLFTNGMLIQPVLETTQSTGVSTTDVSEVDVPSVPIVETVDEPVFFFLYNTDNYFHFLYDAIPVLSQLPHPRPKLLMNPRHWYPYILDTLQLLGISRSDVVIARSDTCYARVLVASSPTHEGMSNAPPHPSIWSVYQTMRNSVDARDVPYPTKVYVSRRSWVHGDKSNMGSDYTTRRRMMCEDELVEALAAKGYTEVFCETMTMSEKVKLFEHATHVVGAIGGGMCNLVFARPECIVTCIASPEFERINHRFLYTMQHTRLELFRNTWSTSNLYRRVRIGSEIGEVVAEEGGELVLAMGNGVTWSADADVSTRRIAVADATFLDNGLNSPWSFSVSECVQLIQ